VTAKRAEAALVIALLAGGLALRLIATRNNHVFAGSDSYGYVHLAEELRAHGRYALGPEPQPLYFARPPLYPLFIAAVKGDARAEMSGGDGWGRITHAQSLLDVLVGLLAFLLARRLAGPIAGALALALAMAMPFGVLAADAALTECLATALATAAIAPLLLLRERPKIAFAVCGALIGLSTLVRPDGLLLVFALVPALLLLDGNRQRAIAAALALAGFAVAFAPWPARNLARFGKAWAFGCRADRYQHPIFNWEGPHHWLASYGRDWETFNWGASCVLDPGCPVSLDRVERDGGIDGPEDRAALTALLARRAKEGLSPAVSRGFDELAAAHRRAHPLRVLVWLPLRRAVLMWSDAYDEVLQNPPPLYGAIRGLNPPLMIGNFVLLLLAGAWLSSRKELRLQAWVLLAAIVVRTAVLAITFYPMPRYIRQVMPLSYVIGAAGSVEFARWLVARRRARIPSG
jgi:4-amino-4-deoxy-L-arabinose transferase-like glycosyltransferase